MSRISPKSTTPTPLVRLIATAIISLTSLLILASCIIFTSFGITDWSILVVWLPGSIILLLAIYLWLGWQLHWVPFTILFVMALLVLIYAESVVFAVYYQIFGGHYFDITGKPIDISPEIPLNPLE